MYEKIKLGGICVDRDNNQIPDKFEARWTYSIACICIIIAIIGYFLKNMDTSTVRWLIGFAVYLSGQRDIGDFLKR